MSSYALMTNTGRNKEAAALANATALDIAEIAWGDGDYTPSGDETALVNEQGRKAVQGSGTVDSALNTAFFEILLDETEGPFVIREAGLFDAVGDLIAIARFDPAVNKPVNTVSALIRINVVFLDLENLVLVVESAEAYVPAERRVIAGTGLTGGGALDEDRTLVADFASSVEAVAGTSIDKVINPATAKAIIEAQVGHLPNLDVDDAIKFGSYSGYCGTHGTPSNGDNPFPTEGGGFALLVAPTVTGAEEQYLFQIATRFGDGSGNQMKMRTRAAGAWQPWFEIWHEGQIEISKGATGYIKMPNGFVLQWSRTSSFSNGDTVTFPVAFPTTCASVVVSDQNVVNDAANAHYIGVDNETATSFEVSIVKLNETIPAAALGFSYIAVGY